MASGKRIGILTSGGDCPGLNAAIHAVLKYAALKGWTVYGIPNGTDGFIDLARQTCQPEAFKIDEHSFDIPGQKGMDVLLFLSGSVLGCRGKKVRLSEEDALILDGYRKLGLDAAIAIGGDGSLEIIYDLAVMGGWNLVAIPKTIDNDVPCTERVIGFDTAVEIAASALYNLTFTAASHDRVTIVQVMGRDAGHLALHAGIVGGADVILIPEIVPVLTEEIIGHICRHVANIRQNRRTFATIVIAEGVKKGAAADREPFSTESVGDSLKRQLHAYQHEHCDRDRPGFCGLDRDIDIRVTVLGHLTRSSPPSALDRHLAVSFGIRAIDLIERHPTDLLHMVVWERGQVQERPLSEVMNALKKDKQSNPCASPVRVPGPIVHVARSLGIYLGEPSSIPATSGFQDN